MKAMKTNGQDILTSHKELKDRPFVAPEGYFESFMAGMSAPAAAKGQNPWKKAMPYMAIAAALTLFFAVGSLLKELSYPTETYSQVEYILFSDNLISIEDFEESTVEQFADAELMEEDIIQYLIYIGAELESIEPEK